MKPRIYPSNKEHFKELIPFAKKILKDNKITPVIYGVLLTSTIPKIGIWRYEQRKIS